MLPLLAREPLPRWADSRGGSGWWRAACESDLAWRKELQRLLPRGSGSLRLTRLGGVGPLPLGCGGVALAWVVGAGGVAFWLRGGGPHPSAIASASTGLGALAFGTVLVVFVATASSLLLGVSAALGMAALRSSAEEEARLRAAYRAASGLPPVFYGYLAAFYVSPAVGAWLPGIRGAGACSAGAALGCLLAPRVALVAERLVLDASRGMYERVLALGSPPRPPVVPLTLPLVWPLLWPLALRASARALGDSVVVAMVVSLARGAGPTSDTLAAAVLRLSLSSLSNPSASSGAIYGFALVLWGITGALSAVGTLPKRAS